MWRKEKGRGEREGEGEGEGGEAGREGRLKCIYLYLCTFLQRQVY